MNATKYLRLMGLAGVLCCLVMGNIALGADESLAYIDPGTGSILLQVFMGLMFGGLFFISLTWRKITGFFKAFFSRVRGGEDVGTDG